MAQLTLLQMTQKILSSMDSDSVNDISDTEESLQVVDIIEDTYYELMSRREWNHLKNPKQLTSLSDSDFPTTLQVPDTVVDMDSLRYEVRDTASDNLSYKKLIYKDPIDFTDMILARSSTDSNIQTLTVKGTSTPLLVKNDTDPTYWTSYDDKHVVLDSYDSSVDTTVVGSKSVAYCTTIPTFNKTSNSYVPECPINMFPLLLAESKRACFFYLKQEDSPIDAKRALAGVNRMKNKDYRTHERTSRARFGRK